MRSRKSGRIVKSTTTSLKIVDGLIELEGARVTEIADALDISKSTVCHHLHTLQEAGYVVLKGDTYHPSLKFAYVGEHAKRRDPAYEVTMKVTQELDEQTPFETSFIVEENGLGRYLTPEVKHPGRYDRFAFTGEREYLHTTAAGKSILASLPRKDVNKIIDRWGLPRETTKTITDEATLLEELDRVRENGYAVNRGENRQDIYVLGKAVHKSNGTVLGALSVGSPANRIKIDEFNDRIVKLLDTHVDTLEERIESVT